MKAHILVLIVALRVGFGMGGEGKLLCEDVSDSEAEACIAARLSDLQRHGTG